jgi:hypothetical protein
MTTTPNRPQVIRYASTELMNQGHRGEFIVVIDSMGRKWNPLLHPRDENGRFIRTFSFVTFDLPGGGTASGRVAGIDRDGNLLVRVQGVTPGADPRVDANGYVKVPHDKVQVRTVKATLSGQGSHSGILTKQENVGVTNSINSLRSLGMGAEADKLSEAQRLAMLPPDPKDPKSRADKEQALELFREVADAVDTERGKGFKEGDDYDEVKANLPKDEATRLQNLDDVTKNTFTARHSLGDKTIEDIETSQGRMQGNMPEVREEAAQNELAKSFADGAKVWDITSGDMVESQLQQPVKAQVRDTAAEPQSEGLPELWRSAAQRIRSGRDRLVGAKQAQQVAPGDRHHVDKNEDMVRVGHITNVDATKSRPEFTGMVTRIYTDAAGKKHIYVRDFDPQMEKGYTKTVKNADGTTSKVPTTYKDHSVQGGSIEIADDDQQSTLFQKLALEGQDEASKSLVKSFTEEYISQMQLRYATPGALKVSGTGGFFDVVPIHLRLKEDANGEKMRIGDAVQGPNGEDGYVSYMEPNANTTKVYWRNGKSSRITSNKLTRMHGPTSEVFPEDSAPGTNNYVPTRDEAAEVAEGKGADTVAQAIRDGGDGTAIQAAMVTDPGFQDKLFDVDALYKRRDETLGTGQGDLSAEDQTELSDWDRLFMASMGEFREPDESPPVMPEAPTPDPAMEGEAPGNPDNPTEKITPEGVTVREEDGNVIVDDNTEDPIPEGDQQAIDQAVQQAATEQPAEAETPEEPEAPPALADKLASDIGRLVEEAKGLPNVDSNQTAQLNQLNQRLADAVQAKDGDAVVRSLQGLTTMINRQVNTNLHPSRLRAVLNGRATGGVPMAQFVQQKLDAGDDIFGAPSPVTRTDRPEAPPSEVPEGVDPEVDKVDDALSQSLTMDDGSTLVMVGDQLVDEGFYVMDHATVTEYDSELTTADITDFLNESAGSNFDGISIWYDEADGRYRMARVGVFDDEDEAGDAARVTGTNQYVNIADGALMNVAVGTDKDAPAEAVEDPRSEERAVRVAGSGTASASTTAKQKTLLDQVAEHSGDTEIARITEAVKNGEEIPGADASRLADVIDGLDAGQFDKPQDKGLASQLAHKLARASGEEGARGYSSQNTALSRTSNVGIGLTAQSQDDNIRSLVSGATEDIKNGDMQAAAQKFREAADAFDALGLPNEKTSARAREHADRLDAMGGVTAPAPEQAPEQAPSQQTPQAPEGGGAGEEGPSVEQALADAGVPEVVPITQNLMSNPDTERAREVTPEEFAQLAAQGKEKLAPRWENASEPEIASGEVLATLKTEAWDSVQEEWGGMTVDAHNAQVIDPDEGFALTVKHPGMETVTVPIGASQEDFDAGMDEAMQRFGGDENGPLWMDGAHLGVFRNEDTGTYDFDPVLVLDSVEEVEQVGAYTHGVGGAYSYADGLGYWPPYVAGGEAGGEGQAVPGEVARPGEEGGEAQPGVGPPGEGEEGQAGPGEAPEVAPSWDRDRQVAPETLPEGSRVQGRSLFDPSQIVEGELHWDGENEVWLVDRGNQDEVQVDGPVVPVGAGDGGPDVAAVESALGSVDNIIDSEVQAEGENGPQGETEAVDEARAQLGLIRGKVTDKGYYTQLSEELRRLAQHLHDNFTGNIDGTVQELRDTADALDEKEAA